MRVLWFCPYPVSRLCPLPVRHRPFVGEHPAPWIVNLAKALRKYYPQVELHIATVDPWVGKSFCIARDGIIFHVCKAGIKLPVRGNWPPFKWNIKTEFRAHRRMLCRVAEEVKPDLIHAHGTESACGLAAMDSGLPYVVSIQGLMHKLTEAFPCDPYFSLRIPMERTVLERGTHFVVKTPFARAFMEEHFPGKKLHDLENPMHEAFFDVPQKKEMGHRLIFVGAVMRTKGIEELLAVMDRHPDWFLSIVGGGVGSYVESLKKKDAQLLNVAWKGMLSSEAIAELMQEHDALVLPSYMDTSPNVVSEAMCAGLPVVATRVGGIPDMVSDGRTGFLVEAKSVTSLDEGLQKLFLNPQKALQMGVEGRKEGHRRFAPELAAKKVFEIYRSVLGENEHA